MRLVTKWLGQSFMCFDKLDSTNRYLKEHAPELSDGAVVLARRQTAGRGRLGRTWEQSSESNLAFSMLFHSIEISELPMLPLVAGLAVAKALETLSGESFSLKWSNDVLFHDKKLSGILCESRICGERAYAVAGVGVNLEQSREELDGLGLVYATSMKLATDKNFEILPVAYEICNQFEPLLTEFEKNGFADIREEYKSRCVTIGKEVRVLDGNSQYTGKAVDIAMDGGLICETDSGLVNIKSGEASIRGLHGYA